MPRSFKWYTDCRETTNGWLGRRDILTDMICVRLHVAAALPTTAAPYVYSDPATTGSDLGVGVCVTSLTGLVR
ncbi:hypothetical protein DICSQDRAFT_137617 [Dichomitus squalens LYAD-421 SS1]|uniref:Uncharacterized protein n=2 Tax=Dichomitus squalens TaxID=114155 RepID=A0A4Q9MLL4_9APHY|nr:uncharacterized protein DICSQDRAFT_137617 [Dichomitus squalens LYAD-421 SS1]EJF60296.1 hypothetical protein DICSQDRAFT_137617 [Dichomitus squalens LYAD-421 SS1]TBU28375.1 hypothetical protein BD311DRAFT_758523 [Dichomitus squalens]